MDSTLNANKMKNTETKDMKFQTWKEFQSALLAKYYSVNNMGRFQNQYDITVYQKLAVDDRDMFFNNLSHEIMHLISESVVTMEQAVSVGFDDFVLLVD